MNHGMEALKRKIMSLKADNSDSKGSVMDDAKGQASDWMAEREDKGDEIAGRAPSLNGKDSEDLAELPAMAAGPNDDSDMGDDSDNPDGENHMDIQSLMDALQKGGSGNMLHKKAIAAMQMKMKK